jgi:hypothetical protein
MASFTPSPYSPVYQMENQLKDDYAAGLPMPCSLCRAVEPQQPLRAEKFAIHIDNTTLAKTSSPTGLS